MALYPNRFGYLTGRQYYGPSLGDPRHQPTMWTNRPASGFYQEENPASNIAIAGAVGAGVFGAGFIPTRTGRVWDKYVGLMRGVE